MSIKLTDTQLLTLSAAAQREHRCIAAPPSLKGAAAQKLAARLVAAGLAKEIQAQAGLPRPTWRTGPARGPDVARPSDAWFSAGRIVLSVYGVDPPPR